MCSSKVFVVEDSTATANLYRSYIEEIDCEAVFFKEGLPVIDALQQSLPDVMILDIELPDISGLDILELISKESLPVTTIVLTSHGSVDNAELPAHSDNKKQVVFLGTLICH
jgi:two-component system, repressor protein LuxO